MLMAERDDPLNLPGVGWKRDRRGNDAKIRQPVAFVGAEFLRGSEHGLYADGRAEILEELGSRGNLYDCA
jgi:hypothetical protein